MHDALRTAAHLGIPLLREPVHHMGPVELPSGIVIACQNAALRGEAGDVDTAAVTLTTGSGRICQISNSRRATYGYDQRIEVHGARGMLRAGNILENTVQIAGADGFKSAPAQPFFLERYAEAYRAEMRYFIGQIDNGAPMTPSIEDGLKAQLLADAADESCKTARPVEVAL